MKVNQMYSVLNDMSKLMFGETAPNVVDLRGFVSMGQSVLSDSGNTDKFLSLLQDKFMGVIIRTLDLEIEYPNIMRHNFEYGAILQKLSIDPMVATEAGAWQVGTLTADQVKTKMFTITKPTVRQKFFEGINTWEVDLSLPDNILKSAFNSPAEMGAFMDAVMSAMVDSVTNQINVTNKYAVNNFIGEKIHGGTNVIHLLTEYGVESPDDEDAIEKMRSKDFLAFMAKRIYDTIGYMGSPSALYNEEGAIRKSDRDELHVFLLNEVESAFTMFLSANTWHKELVELPFHQRVTAWQNFGHLADAESSTPFAPANLKDASRILVKTASGDDVHQKWVVGAIFDREAVGTSVFNRKTMTDRLNRLELTQYTNKVDVGYFNDLSENGCIFVLD